MAEKRYIEMDSTMSLMEMLLTKTQNTAVGDGVMLAVGVLNGRATVNVRDNTPMVKKVETVNGKSIVTCGACGKKVGLTDKFCKCCGANFGEV